MLHQCVISGSKGVTNVFFFFFFFLVSLLCLLFVDFWLLLI